MPRIRTIKPEFWSDEKMAPESDATRLLFLALISMADDCGRLLDSPKQIEAFIWPHENRGKSVRDGLATLARLGRIARGETSAGQKVIQIVNWSRHQKVDHPNYSSAFPELVANASRAHRELVANHSRLLSVPVPVPTTSTSTAEGFATESNGDGGGNWWPDASTRTAVQGFVDEFPEKRRRTWRQILTSYLAGIGYTDGKAALPTDVATGVLAARAQVAEITDLKPRFVLACVQDAERRRILGPSAAQPVGYFAQQLAALKAEGA